MDVSISVNVSSTVLVFVMVWVACIAAFTCVACAYVVPKVRQG